MSPKSKPEIRFFSENVNLPSILQKQTKTWLMQVAKAEKKQIGNLSYIFCSDNYLLEMNRQYLQHDYYTDVITFDYSRGNMIAGDIFISTDRVKENAKKLGVNYKHETLRVICHGLLHLCGHQDKTLAQQKKMRQLEEKYLKIKDI